MYSITAESYSNNDAAIHIKQSNIAFNTTPKTAETLPNPAELFLGSFAACILKNVERFSGILKFSYDKAVLTVKAIRTNNPPKMDNLEYELIIYSTDESLNIDLLKKNIEKFGTIYNTVSASCSISGKINKKSNV